MTTPNDGNATEAPAAEDSGLAEDVVPVEDAEVTDVTALAALAGPPVDFTAADRPRGLDAYFAPGGEDEATEERRADERRNLRLLLLMVAALVLIPTLLTIAALAQELINRQGG